MRICYLTQTATDISDYYKAFFKGKDLFFVTFKNPNPNAIAFVPKSTWSDGRNRLWEELKNKYDYYVFIDDDIIFYHYNKAFSTLPYFPYLLYRLRLRYLNSCYRKAEPDYFFNRLAHYLQKYQPEVMSISQVNEDPNGDIDATLLSKNKFVRRLGYFDAQCTILSNYAAGKILPYDNKISGWWSAQIPVYLYAHHVFAKKAISVIELGAVNSHWSKGGYVENYNGRLDCVTMLEEISKATNRDYNTLAGSPAKYGINATYGEKEIVQTSIQPTDTEDYQANYEASLKGLETFLHPHLVP